MNDKLVRISSLLVVLALAACGAAPEGPEDSSPDIVSDDVEDEENLGESADALSTVTLEPGNQASFSTWVFINTNVKITNLKTNWGVVTLQAGGANPEWLWVPPGTFQHVSRYWGGWPVTVANKGSVPLYVEVW